jgi:thiamine biosynthesis lipoprotein
LFLALVVAACGPSIEQIEMFGDTMGTTYTLKVVGTGINKSELGRQTKAALERINAQMSTWRPDSEISRFNRIRTNDWFEISDEFMLVLAAAGEINRQTRGSFDVTVTGLVNLWGFGSSDRRRTEPDAEAITEQLRHTGPATFEIDLANNRIRKLDTAAQLDLSAIAKGYAVDALAKIPQKSGIGDFLVEIGGEVKASGRRLDGAPWRVAIERPDSLGGPMQTTVPLVDAAIATSGDYRDYILIGGKRYSHIIDPGTGYPPDNGVASVSVIANDAMSADALATGIMVMGTEQALALATEKNLAVMIIERDGDSFRIFSSDAFEALQAAPSDWAVYSGQRPARFKR